MAFLLDDAVHGRGIGTLLLEQLAAVARESGVRHLHADTLAENAAMLRVFARLRLPAGAQAGQRCGRADRSTPRIGARRWTGWPNGSVRPRTGRCTRCSPGAVAVIGAGRKPGGIGHEVLRNLADGNFTGRLYAVNPHADRIGEIAAYPSSETFPGRSTSR